MPLREDRYIGAPVFAVFDNLLPDNDAIRRSVANHVGAGGTDMYSLLAAIGRDCVGALQFLSDGEAPGPVGEIHGEPIDNRQIAKILSALHDAPLGIGDDRDFRLSIAGVQHKTALLFWNNTMANTPWQHGDKSHTKTTKSVSVAMA